MLALTIPSVRKVNRVNRTDMDLVDRLKTFMENEARSCSMDYGCVTPEYVYRMWGESVAIDEIATGLAELRKQGAFGL